MKTECSSFVNWLMGRWKIDKLIELDIAIPDMPKKVQAPLSDSINTFNERTNAMRDYIYETNKITLALQKKRS